MKPRYVYRRFIRTAAVPRWIAGVEWHDVVLSRGGFFVVAAP